MVKSTSTSVRHPWTATTVWGWRLELLLGLTTVVLMAVSRALLPSGPLLVALLGAILFLGTPTWRTKFEHAARQNHQTACLHFVMLHSGLTNRLGQIPKVVDIASTGVATTYQLRLPVGIDFVVVEKACNQIASGMAARSVRARSYPANAQLCELVVIRGNAFPAVVPMPELRTRSINLWQPQPFGVGEDGNFIAITLPEHNLLIGGEPGSGKSVALSVDQHRPRALL